jgi:Putative MetA-pathway of phenol degradation
MKKYILTFCFLVMSNILFAQIEKLESDRPGQTNSPFSVPKKMIQTEIGFQKQTYRFQPILQDTYFQLPSLLIKYGVLNKIELRFLFEYAQIREENIQEKHVIMNGINNFQLGAKYNFLEQKGLIPKTALIAHYNFNTLNTNLKERDTTNGGNVRLAMQHIIIPEKIILGYNIGLELKTWDSRRKYLFTFSPKFIISEKWQMFAEIYGFFWESRKPQTYIDGGLSYLINDNLKIDVNAGTIINDKNYLKFYSLGASYRFRTSKKEL